MKKAKQILAAAGVILLICLYGSTLLFAFTDHSQTMGLFKASVACTILVPVLLYAFSVIRRLTRKDGTDTEETD